MSISLRRRTWRAGLVGCASGAALLVLAVGQASAATYPGGGSTFSGSAEGWKVAASPEKKCKLLGLVEGLCTTAGGYDGSVGAPPGSYAVSTNIPVNLITSFKGEMTIESPTFTVDETGSGSLSLARAFDPGELSSVNPQFSYTAYLLDKSTNTKQKAIAETIEGTVPFAGEAGVVSLAAGHSYVIQIETSDSSTLASAGLVGGEAIGRFDNVVVSGPSGGEGSGGGGGNGGNGGNGAEGGSGAGGATSARLESLIQSSGLIGPAVLKGNRLSVKARCPAKVGATCTLSLRGMLSRHKAATAGRKAKVRKGKTKNFALVVKPAARKTLRTRSKLLFKETAKAGKAKATIFKSLRLIRR